MFSQACVKNSSHGGRGMRGKGGYAWYGGGGPVWQGVCVVGVGGCMHGRGRA